ncbi:MAG: creatininase family protein [Actinobacteria bacterium]|nr:creatininase family protein [Actinomycetota bacterium]
MEYINLSFEELKKINPNDVIILLPVGSLEVHGPYLPFGSDVYIAEAFSFLIEQKIKSIIMPSIYYSYSGVTKEIHGSISIDIVAVSNYLENILTNLIELKFKKILLINIHKDNDSLIKLSISKIFDKTNIPVMYINPYENFSKHNSVIFSKRSNSYKETSLILASLKILGKQLEIKKVDYKKSGYEKPIFIQKLRNVGYIRFDYKNEFEHLSPEDGVSIDEGMKYMEVARDEVLKELKYLDDYLNYLKKNSKL